MIIAHTAGKMRKNRIRVLAGRRQGPGWSKIDLPYDLWPARAVSPTASSRTPMAPETPARRPPGRRRVPAKRELPRRLDLPEARWSAHRPLGQVDPADIGRIPPRRDPATPRPAPGAGEGARGRPRAGRVRKLAADGGGARSGASRSSPKCCSRGRKPTSSLLPEAAAVRLPGRPDRCCDSARRPDRRGRS
ncbi:hypothetical protein ACRAWD_17770 [Caulobacter segnis]